MQVSVVIGTYNRQHLLVGTLGALASQEVPGSLAWEIVVVDNNSTDSTAQVVAAFAETTPTPVRYVFEPRQGISHARNRGIREARGAVLAFIDDDVLPANDWVSQVVAAVERWEADGVGGRILPRWEASPPHWLRDNRSLLRRLSIMEFDGSCLLALPLKPVPQVWGANMAFRRDVFHRVGEFDPRRGVVGKTLHRGEESDLIERALDLGLRIAYDAALTVFHRIGPDRTRKAYFRRMAFEDARGEARLKSDPARTRDSGSAPLVLPRRRRGLLQVGGPRSVPTERDLRSGTSLEGVAGKTVGLLVSGPKPAASAGPYCRRLRRDRVTSSSRTLRSSSAGSRSASTRDWPSAPGWAAPLCIREPFPLAVLVLGNLDDRTESGAHGLTPWAPELVPADVSRRGGVPPDAEGGAADAFHVSETNRLFQEASV